MRPDKLLSGLIAHLQSSSQRGRAAMLRLLQQWLKSHLASWDADLRERWGLDGFAGMDLLRYPIDEASLDPDEELRQLKSVPPTSMELLAMRLRNIFWAGITVESTAVCPRCSEAQLRILEDAHSDAIVLSCDLCAWSQTPNGEPWHGARRLEPAPKARIERWKDTGC
jgi:hypothetical protein